MRKLSERDVCTKFITPAVLAAGWDLHKQIREEVSFTAGRIIPKGKTYSRKQGKRSDYILYYKPNIPLAIIEAKDNTHSVGSGMQQALEYAEILDIPFVYSSNGKGFLEHDRTGTANQMTSLLALDEFPSPQELWGRYREYKGFTKEEERKSLPKTTLLIQVAKHPDIIKELQLTGRLKQSQKGRIEYY